MEREIEYLIDRLTEEYPFLKEKRDLLRTRIIWGIPKGFSYFWGDDFGIIGAILIRPVNEELITKGTFDYWDTFWEFDPEGDILWVDYAYGPGLYPEMIHLCQTTGCPKIGWRHRDRMHVRPMNRMPHKTMRLAFHI